MYKNIRVVRKYFPTPKGVLYVAKYTIVSVLTTRVRINAPPPVYL